MGPFGFRQPTAMPEYYDQGQTAQPGAARTPMGGFGGAMRRIGTGMRQIGTGMLNDARGGFGFRNALRRHPVSPMPQPEPVTPNPAPVPGVMQGAYGQSPISDDWRRRAEASYLID